MTRKIKTFTLAILLFAILGIAACGGNKEASRFIGSWKCTDSNGYPTTITFNADGTWTRHVESALDPKGQDYTGKYKVDDDKRTLTINIDPLPDSRVKYTTEVFYHYTLTEDTLTLRGSRDSAENAEVYKRVR